VVKHKALSKTARKILQFSVIGSWGEKKMKKTHVEFEVTLFRIAEC